MYHKQHVFISSLNDYRNRHCQTTRRHSCRLVSLKYTYIHVVVTLRPVYTSRVCHVTFSRVFVGRFMELDTLSLPIIYYYLLCFY